MNSMILCRKLEMILMLCGQKLQVKLKLKTKNMNQREMMPKKQRRDDSSKYMHIYTEILDIQMFQI